MILQILSWWVASTVLGAAAFPLGWRLFHRLPDRGFGVSRALGVLLGGYLLWLGVSLGWLQNNPAGGVAAVLVVMAAGALAGNRHWKPMIQWLRANARSLVVMELVFLLAFVAWAVVRSYNPEIVATEKPMELAFLSSILHSPQFPPRDPWLSGNAISYYYLGYVLLALLSWLTGVTAGVAFNLGNALWFGLVAAGSYAIVYNLLAMKRGAPRRLASLLGPLMVVVVGNLAGVFEVMHAQHWFWETQPDGPSTSRFWTWLNLDDLTTPPAGSPVFPPNRFWFWWQGARVVNDVNLTLCPPESPQCNHVEVIDEFPFFSFLLADNHPHVLTLPFDILALMVALQVFATARPGGFRLQWLSVSPRLFRRAILILVGGVLLVVLARATQGAIAGGLPREVVASALRGILLGAAGVAVLAAFAALVTGRESSLLSTSELLLVGWLLGCLAFLNTWDLPIYLALILAAALWGSRQDGFALGVRRLVVTGVAIAVLAVVAVLPWLPTFASQAGGLLPNLVFPTRLPQFLIMFAVPIVPAGLWLALSSRDEIRRPGSWRIVIGWTVGLPLALLLTSWLLAAAIALFNPQSVADALNGLGAGGWRDLVRAALFRRVDAPSVALLVSLVLSLAWLYLRGANRKPPERAQGAGEGVFVVLMIGFGAALVLIPEFFYLRDSFGSRMNTVFKFYYAAWLLWGVAAAYALAGPWESFGRRGRAWMVVAAIPLCLGLVYTTTALWEKANHFAAPNGPTLDGTAHLDQDDPADAAAIRWMSAALDPGVVAEAVGGSYSSYGRISAHTGFSTVLGWDFHEFQWRGSFEPQGTRRADIERLYVTRDWAEAQSILDRYEIAYVFIGPLERSTYEPVVTRKFDLFMDLLYQTEDVSIYGRKAGVES